MDKNQKLNLLFLKHREWIKIASVYGAREYSEDLIQDMYLRLLEKPKYLSKAVENGIVKDGYVFFIIKTMLINKSKKDARDVVETILDTFDYIEDSKEDLSSKIALEGFYNKIDKISDSWRWYDREIFNIYKNTSLSIRGISKKTDISHVSIFNTLKKCKAQVKEILLNDWLEYKKGNYEIKY